MKHSKWTALFATVLISVGSLSVLAAYSVQDPPNQIAGELRFKAPPEWIVEKPSSAMRLAQYKLPKVDGDSEDASLVLYFFGENQGGSVQANLERWVSQFEQPDGSSSSAREPPGKTATARCSGTAPTTHVPGTIRGCCSRHQGT